MGSLQAENESNQELDDSGYGQEDSISMKKASSSENGGYAGSAELLDLSDDVLLCILKYCTPRDLKALGYTCPRLGALVVDRTLWESVDARESPSGPKRLRWLLTHGLSSTTSELMLCGYAREAAGCLGHMNCKHKEEEPTDLTINSLYAGVLGNPEQSSNGDLNQAVRGTIFSSGPVAQIYDSIPRGVCYNALPEAVGKQLSGDWAPPDDTCPGPQFTLTQNLLTSLEQQCPNLTTLALDYCNIDCSMRAICHFPRRLKVLSLRGSKCYNQPLDKSFLFKIQDYLKELEELDVSECEWVEPSCLLPLSKLSRLQLLRMRRCMRMSECVAYSSLATRYGFKTLKVIDLRESPVGDSEVSSFGWVGSLEELYVSPAMEAPAVHKHAHYIGDNIPEHVELDDWEMEEPDYFKVRSSKVDDPAPADSKTVTKKHKLDEGQTDRNVTDDFVPAQKRIRLDDIPRVCSCKSVIGNTPSSVYAMIRGDSRNRNDRYDDVVKQDLIEDEIHRQNLLKLQKEKEKASEDKAAGSSGDGDAKPENGGGEQNDVKMDEPRPEAVNQGASTSKDDPQPSTSNKTDQKNGEKTENKEPKQNILYVNVGRRLHAMYRLAIPVYKVGESGDSQPAAPSRRLDVSSAYQMTRFDPTTLVSDTTVHRFGRADSDNINYINIGPNGQHDQPATRPDRSNLRILSLTGFRNITNRSLVHLATAAPRLRFIDFSGTRVTQRGVDTFRSLRPDCEIIYSQYIDWNASEGDMAVFRRI